MGSFKTRTALVIASIVAFFVLLSLAQETNRRWQVQREVQRLEQEVHTSERKLIELQNLNQYFRTDDYQERLAREKLNFRAPGEEVVLIPEEAVVEKTATTELATSDPPRSIPAKWWYVLFVSEEPFMYE